MRRVRRAVIRWLPAIVAVGCVAPPDSPGGATSDSPDSVVTMDVAAHTVECVGEAVQRCLLVRRDGESRWTRFYGTIEGFTHEEGYEFRIQVDRREVANPPADASAFEYRLVRVVWKRPSSADVPGSSDQPPS
jgi:hypothetical protein